MSSDVSSTQCRRLARKEDRRQAMLAVARDSFLANGYAATTMSAIAARIGGSKATLWSYFPNKEALFGAVLEDATTDYRRQLAEDLTLSGDMRAAVERFARSLLTKIMSPQAIALHRLVVSESARFPEVGRVFHDRAVARTERLLRDFLAARMADGQLRPGDPGRAARLVLGQCTALQQRVLWGVEQVDAARITEEARMVTDLFLRAFAPEPAPAPAAP